MFRIDVDDKIEATEILQRKLQTVIKIMFLPFTSDEIIKSEIVLETINSKDNCFFVTC